MLSTCIQRKKDLISKCRRNFTCEGFADCPYLYPPLYLLLIIIVQKSSRESTISAMPYDIFAYMYELPGLPVCSFHSLSCLSSQTVCSAVPQFIFFSYVDHLGRHLHRPLLEVVKQTTATTLILSERSI